MEHNNMKLEHIKAMNFIRGTEAAQKYLNDGGTPFIAMTQGNEFSRGFNAVVFRVRG